MPDQPGGEPTEQPTEKRKRELRRKGVIARTPELTVWGGLLVAGAAGAVTLSRLVATSHDLLARMYTIMEHPDEAAALRFVGYALSQVVLCAAPLFVTLSVFLIVANLAQTRGSMSAALLAPKLERISLTKGFKRLFGVQSLWGVVKSAAKIAVLALVAWGPVRGAVTGFLRQGPMDPAQLARVLGAQTLALVQLVGLAGLGLAAVDYLVTRRRVRRQSLMTKQEVKQELTDQEGNPEIRGRRRALQRRMAFEVRQLQALRTADVVVVNPTHYAVAFRYDPQWGPPKVVARGVDRFALQIRGTATELGVPVVEDPALARFLHASTRVNGAIGEDLFGVVAVLLHFVASVDRRGARAHEVIKPHGTLLGRAGISTGTG